MTEVKTSSEKTAIEGTLKDLAQQMVERSPVLKIGKDIVQTHGSTALHALADRVKLSLTTRKRSPEQVAKEVAEQKAGVAPTEKKPDELIRPGIPRVETPSAFRKPTEQTSVPTITTYNGPRHAMSSLDEYIASKKKNKGQDLTRFETFMAIIEYGLRRGSEFLSETFKGLSTRIQGFFGKNDAKKPSTGARPVERKTEVEGKKSPTQPVAPSITPQQPSAPVQAQNAPPQTTQQQSSSTPATSVLSQPATPRQTANVSEQSPQENNQLPNLKDSTITVLGKNIRFDYDIPNPLTGKYPLLIIDRQKYYGTLRANGKALGLAVNKIEQSNDGSYTFYAIGGITQVITKHDIEAAVSTLTDTRTNFPVTLKIPRTVYKKKNKGTPNESTELNKSTFEITLTKPAQ